MTTKTKLATGLTACCLLISGGLYIGVSRPSTPVSPEAPLTLGGSRPSAQPSNTGQPLAQAVANPAAATATEQKSPYPETRSGLREIVVNGVHYPIRSYRAMMAPDDPSASQWWTTGTGLPAAWDKAGDSPVTIAIIDSGVALDHEELSNRWFERSGEQGAATEEAASDLNCSDQGKPVAASCNNIDDDQDGINDNEKGAATAENASFLNCTDRSLPLDKSCNRIDDDNNGFIDDVHGWDFISGDPSVQAGETNPDGEGAGHGTAVAGTAAATGNNGVGIAGVNWTAKLLPLQALDDNGDGDTLSVSRAIRYAADQGAQVINLSLGSSEEDPYMRQAVKYALDHGAIVVAASGNDGCDCIVYPARYPEVVAVGAYQPNGTVAPFSNYGDTLDLVAPGAGMYLPYWRKTNGTAGYASNLAGTSFATPYVSGLLASAKAVRPEASWGELANLMMQTADHKSLTLASPHSVFYGSGYVRADTFLQRLSGTYDQSIRYGFATRADDTLGSSVAAACAPGEIPSAPFYEIKQGNSVYYTVSELTARTEQNKGASVTQKGLVCVGLPSDQVAFSRLIDPAREFSNVAPKQ